MLTVSPSHLSNTHMLLLLETATDICSIGISRENELLSLVEIDERADHAARINELTIASTVITNSIRSLA